MNFDPGFEIRPDFEHMDFLYGHETFGPTVEHRKLEAIRASLLDPNCQGPEIVYSIAMDVGKAKDRPDLIRRNLLYGTVIYAQGQLGNEPIRSQGHIHAVSASIGSSTPEVYEIWTGKAIIYMQETANDVCGCCYAVEGQPGDIIVVPPGWAHATISADPHQPLTFGAWCVRDYGFDYSAVRAHKGLAYYPVIVEGQLTWVKNNHYQSPPLILKRPRTYYELNIAQGVPIYRQYELVRHRFDFVKNPSLVKEVWDHFIP